MLSIFVSLIVGCIFGIGLAFGGMLDPSKVVGFLDIFGAWAPSLAFVMMGGMFAGHDEGGGEIIEKKFKTHQYEVDVDGTLLNPIVETKKFVQFYGMSSDTAMKKHSGGVASYRASEGRTVEVPYKGSVDNTVKDLLGGLRSTCTYVGAPTLKQLSKCTTFVRVTQQFNGVFVK